MANGQFGGLVADIPGAVERGLQFRQQSQLRPIELQQQKLGIQRQQQQLETGNLQQQQNALSNQQQQAIQRATILGQSAQALRSLPIQQRDAAFSSIEPQLESFGIPRGTFKAGQFTDLNLDRAMVEVSAFIGAPKAQAGFTLGQGQQRFDASGSVIASVAPTEKLSSLQQKVAAEGLDPNTPAGQARAREITQGTRTDPSLKPSDQQLLNKATEGQLATAGFANRVNSANKVIAEIESTKGFDPTDISAALLGQIPLGNIAQSTEHQQFIQAKRDFITAVLRKESGAVIGESEFQNEDKKFFPQIGDKPEVLDRKRKGRERAFDNLKKQSKGVFNVQFNSDNSGELSQLEQSELAELERKFGGQ